MNMKLKIVFYFLSFILFYYNIFSHDNLRVHPKITDRSFEVFADKIGKDNYTLKYAELDIFKGTETEFPKEGYKLLYDNTIEGSYGEDVPEYSGVWHFYFYGDGGSGLFEAASALEKAIEVFKESFEQYDYNKESKSLSYYTLGRSIHLCQDMSVPAHVQEDPHVGRIFSSESDDFEET